MVLRNVLPFSFDVYVCILSSQCVLSSFIFSYNFYRINTTNFATTVRKYNALEPFNMSPLRHFAETMSNKGIIKNLNIFIPISAAHLYDSVILYAKVRHHLTLLLTEEGFKKLMCLTLNTYNYALKNICPTGTR